MWRARKPLGGLLRFSNSETESGSDPRQKTDGRELVKNITGEDWKQIYHDNEKAKDVLYPKLTKSHFLGINIDGQKHQQTMKGKDKKRQNPAQNVTSEMQEDFGDVLARAKMYQEYMKDIPIPKERGSVIPYHSWHGLGKSIKKMYKQPLHYRTNVMLNDWDKGRMNTENEMISMDEIIHSAKAETLIWLVEENHRANTSSEFLAKIWVKDPMYHAFVDPYASQS